jgi:hypothetical protein
MTRYSVAAILALVYVACSVWLVRREGAAYRDELRRERHAAGAIRSGQAAQAGESSRKTAPRAASDSIPRPSPPSADRRDLHRVAGPSLPSATTAANAPPPSRSAATVAKAERNQTRAASSKPGKPAPKFVPNRLLPVEHDSLWDNPALTKAWDLDRLTADDEGRIGSELHRLILGLNAGLKDDAWLSRLDAIADPLRKLCLRKDVEYRFTILNSEIANIFSHAGGYIYVSRKLLEMVGEDEDYVLEFAVAHEMAHVDKLHALQCLQARDVKTFQDGTLTKLYLLVIPLAYPDELEYDADRWAFQTMKRLGRSDHDCLAFLRKLEVLARRDGFSAGRAGPIDEPSGQPKASPIENHLRSHPAVRRRLEQVKQLTIDPASSQK